MGVAGNPECQSQGGNSRTGLDSGDRGMGVDGVDGSNRGTANHGSSMGGSTWEGLESIIFDGNMIEEVGKIGNHG